MYQIFFSDRAEKQLKKLEKTLQQRILAGLERIRVRPEIHVTRLVGEQGYKLRAGDYRIIMDIDRGKLIILVIKVGHRKDIYKKP
ncbi:type II toxin-antitoxin system RelE/ParE family toxin [Candidatus Woesearchaeota archaeon]|nr:type II toxin-antitoxin system RelE/ParE family toxin [Candidatus Woesearchaeota archaeon]